MSIFFSLQVVRDLGFIIPDCLHILLPILALIRSRRESLTTRAFLRDRKIQIDCVGMLIYVGLLFIVYSFL